MDELAITKLIELVEGVSPAIWQAAQRQVKVDLLVSFIVLWTCVGVLLLLWFALRKQIERKIETAEREFEERDLRETLDIILGAGTVLCITIIAIILLCSIGPLLNPDYYAIKNIIRLVPR